MSAWTKRELDKIAAADELEIASLRRDSTLREPVTVWVVRHGDDLYVRSVRGPTGAWFLGTKARHEGRIQAGGVEKDVTFVKADDVLKDEIDHFPSESGGTPGRPSSAASNSRPCCLTRKSVTARDVTPERDAGNGEARLLPDATL